MGMWWKGARLVFERSLVENVRSTSFTVVTVLLLLLSAAASERASVGFAVGFALCMALLLGGTAITTTVAVEKSTRISEVLLAVVRPSQILVGNVLAVGTITLMQLLIVLEDPESRWSVLVQRMHTRPGRGL